MKDHQLWIDTLNMNIQAGKTLQEALLCADALSGWPFRTVNGEQTPDSVALETSKQPKPLTPQSGSSRILSQYARVMSDPGTQEAML